MDALDFTEKPTVLVVDDDPLCVAVVTAKLEPSFHVVSTTEPKRAVDLAREEMASIVLCDISMPGLSGDEVAYALTQDTWTRDIPVVYLTGLLDPQQFFRISRQYLVGFSAIQSVLTHFKGKLKLELTPKARHEVFVSGDRMTDFKEWLGR